MGPRPLRPELGAAASSEVCDAGARSPTVDHGRLQMPMLLYLCAVPRRSSAARARAGPWSPGPSRDKANLRPSGDLSVPLANGSVHFSPDDPIGRLPGHTQILLPSGSV